MVKQHAYDSLQGQLDEKTIDSPSEMGLILCFCISCFYSWGLILESDAGLVQSSASTSHPLAFIVSQGPTQLLSRASNLWSSCLGLLNIWDYEFSLAGMVVSTWPCSAVSLKEGISPLQNGFDHR